MKTHVDPDDTPLSDQLGTKDSSDLDPVPSATPSSDYLGALGPSEKDSGSED